MSQQRSRRPARSRQRPPRVPKSRATRVAEPVTPAAMAPEPHGDISGALAVGVAAGALAVVVFLTILIAMAAM